MFGRSKQKNSPVAPADQASGAIIQGFVCPMCLSSFSNGSELEVHFQLSHDKPKVEDDEMVLLRQQLSASEQTRDLMQREIAHHVEAIRAMEASIASLNNSRGETELSLQQALSDLASTQQQLEKEHQMRLVAIENRESAEHELSILRDALQNRPDSGLADQLSEKLEASERQALLVKSEADRAIAEHTTEVAKLQDNLSNVQRSYKEFMDSLNHLIQDIEYFEANGEHSSDTESQKALLEPQNAIIVENFSKTLNKHLEDKQKLKSSVREHELMRESFVQERSKLEERLNNLEALQSKTRSKIFELSKYVTSSHGGDQNASHHVSDMDDFSLLEVLKKSFDSLHDKNEHLQAEIERNVSDEEVLSRLKQEYETLIEERNGEISSLTSDSESNKKRLAEMEHANNGFKARISSLEAEIASLSGEKSFFEKAAEAQRDLMKNAFAQLSGSQIPDGNTISDTDFMKSVSFAISKIEQLENEVKSLQIALTSKEESHSSIVQRNLALEEELIVKNNNVSQLNATISELRETVSKHIHSISCLDENAKSANSRYSELDQKFNSQLGLIESLKRDKDLAETNCRLVGVESEKARGENDELRSTISAKDAEIVAINAKLQAAEEFGNHSESQLNALRQSVTEFERRVASLTEQIIALENEQRAKASETSALEQSLRTCQERLSVTEGQLVAQQQLFDESRTETANLQTEIDHLRNILQSKEVALSSEIEKWTNSVKGLELSVSKEKLIVSELNAEVRLAREAYRNLEKANSQLASERQAAFDEASLLRKKIEDVEQAALKVKADHMSECLRIKTEAEKNIETKETAIRSSFSELETKLRLEMSGLVSRLEQSQGENQDLDDEINDLQRRYQELQLALQELGREQQNLQIQTHRIKEHRWVDDSDVEACSKCTQKFSITVRRHHCRRCGLVFCHGCSSKNAVVGAASKKPVRVCDGCFKDVHDS